MMIQKKKKKEKKKEKRSMTLKNEAGRWSISLRPCKQIDARQKRKKDNARESKQVR